jgi:hypothetical protein
MLYIYEHIRPDTNAVFYVGKGTEKRMHSKHRRNVHWNNIVRKAGGFAACEVCQHEDEELLFLAEQERIDQLKRLGVKLSNKTDGGEGPSGYRHTEEAKRKITEAQLGVKHHAYRKPMLEHTKQALLKANKGRKHTDEHRKKVSEAGKLRKNSPKTRALISQSKQGGKHHMAVSIKYNGIVFDCAKSLANHLGMNHSTIRSRVYLNPQKWGYEVLGYTKDLKGK